MSERERICLVYDCVLKRPACVLLQAVMGGGDAGVMHDLGFDSDSWLLAPTPDMRRIAGTREEWLRAAAITAAEMKRLSGTKDSGPSLRQSPETPRPSPLGQGGSRRRAP